jgi:N-acetylmuramoyl-L-alanine amidase
LPLLVGIGCLASLPTFLTQCGGGSPGYGGATSYGPSPASLGVVQNFIPDGRFGRQVKLPLRPTYITVHSTQSMNATARNHASLLNRGGIPAKTHWNRHRFNIWHFTVDDGQTIQHMPLNEQGEHADHEGPGNTNSIGIEICEFRSSSRQAAAIDRTARLVASLANAYRIPTNQVVPHWHWPMRPNGYHKNCPRILLNGGQPGPRWQRFLSLVDRYR